MKRIDLRGVPAADWRLPQLDIEADLPVDSVRDIIDNVRLRGDAALREYSERFDGVELGRLVLDPFDLERAAAMLPQRQLAALELAADRVRTFHEHQVPDDRLVELDGVAVTTLHRPVERAGSYVPGGRALYPSTVIMTAVPAAVAGVDEVIVCVPPAADGAVPPVTLAAAHLAGVDRVHPVGGAHAIAAMAFGTESVPQVDVIVGPGNNYVATAKRLLSAMGTVKVPAAFAGPSEVVVIADAGVEPEWVAADIVLQAEHGPDGLGWLIAWDATFADAVEASVEAQLASAARSDDIQATLASRGVIALVDSRDAAAELANLVAPEHLQVMVDDPVELVDRIRHAGEVFIGPWSTAAAGDYLAGPSHVLPTARTARFGQALTVTDFLKEMHVVDVSEDGLRSLGPAIVEIAEAEGFDAHARAVRIRTQDET